MTDLVVFIPAWNEEASLPAVLDELHADLPDAAVVVVDDGSTDATARVAADGGATVVGFPSNRGLPHAIAAGYRHALDAGYAICGRVDADGQHPVAELRRLVELVREDRCDVAVGSRFVSGDGYAPYRYRPSGARRLGTALLRRGMRIALRRPFADATSGMYAVNRTALPVLAEPFSSAAPEVEALMRLSAAGLRIEEVPVNMRERAQGRSKLRGRKALAVVVTVCLTLVGGHRLLRKRS